MLHPVRLGVPLHQDESYVRSCEDTVLPLVDCVELRADAFADADGLDRIERVLAAHRPAVLGHGDSFALGAANPPPRRAAVIARIERAAKRFDVAGYSERLGFRDFGPLHVPVDLPLPTDEECLAVVVRGARTLQQVVPRLAVVNASSCFALGDPLQQPRFLAEVCAAAPCWLALDLHSGLSFCHNTSVSFDDWLDLVPFDRVVQIRLGGGQVTDPQVVDGRRSFLLPTLDGPVPEPVWEAFAVVLPRCSALSDVIVEHVPRGFDTHAAADLCDDLERARRCLC